MKIINQEFFDKAVESNQDAYGLCIIKFAIQWADLMEDLIKPGKFVSEIAEECHKIIDERPGFGITGSMYGYAVNLLANCWKYGEELRKWHNKQYGRPDSDGVIDPAVIVIN